MITAFTLGLSVQMQTETSNFIMSGKEGHKDHIERLLISSFYKRFFKPYEITNILMHTKFQAALLLQQFEFYSC